jgi:hypothetical protein
VDAHHLVHDVIEAPHLFVTQDGEPVLTATATLTPGATVLTAALLDAVQGLHDRHVTPTVLSDLQGATLETRDHSYHSDEIRKPRYTKKTDARAAISSTEPLALAINVLVKYKHLNKFS